jgi:membrane fusion protein, multidrug efflux system
MMEGQLKNKKHWKKALALSALGLVMVLGSVFYYQYSQKHPSSDDAYVNAHVIYLAPQVDGTVLSVAVENNQTIKAGQILFKIDPAPYQYAKDQAVATLKLDQSKLSEALANVVVAEANLKQAQADLFTAKANEQRISILVKEHQASPQEGDQAQGAYLSAQAKVLAMEASVIAAQKNVSVAEHEVEVSEANLKTAELNLSYTDVIAPAAGRLSEFMVRPGNYVIAGTSLFQLVEEDLWWVDTNYKETQIQHIHSGQVARIKMDMYPGHIFKGTVFALSPSSGASFSLLPPENATGNWVKVVQRYPVQVNLELTDAEKSAYPLRVGASSNVTVDV